VLDCLGTGGGEDAGDFGRGQDSLGLHACSVLREGGRRKSTCNAQSLTWRAPDSNATRKPFESLPRHACGTQRHPGALDARFL
jgi:hypothetical protein